MANGTDNKVEIEIAIRDSMSVALQTVGREFAALNRKAQESAQSGSGLHNVDSLLTNMGKSLLGPLGIAAGFIAAAKSLDTFAISQLQIRNFARDTGLSTEQVSKLRAQLALSGVDAGTAGAAIGGITAKLQEAMAIPFGSTLVKQLSMTNPALAMQVQQFASAGKEVEALEAIHKAYVSTTLAGQAAIRWATGMSATQILALGVDIRGVAKEWVYPTKASEDYVKTMYGVKTSISNIWTDVSQHAVEKIGEITGSLGDLDTTAHTVSDNIKKFMDVDLIPTLQTTAQEFTAIVSQLGKVQQWFDTHGGANDPLKTAPPVPQSESDLSRKFKGLFRRQSYEDEGALPPHAQPISFTGDASSFGKGGVLGALQARGYSLPPWMQQAYGFMQDPQVTTAMGLAGHGGGAASTATRALLEAGAGEAQVLLRDIRDILQRIEDKPSSGRETGQQAAGQYGTGIRGGQMQGGLGGFRGGGAYGSGGAGTRAERNNNPGNIKFGDFAKAQGATGADKSGFAIFPDKEAGFKAAENLLGSKGYEGLTLGQIGQKWAAGDSGWAANVSKATGIDVGAVPTSEQRTQIARQGIPVAEGFGGGGGGGAVPSAILLEARKAALTGGPGAVQRYIRDKGYNVDSAWCGDFAAAVVRAAGGTPPRNPQIASNWRNYGQQVETPGPGDIAVRRGAGTGSTGSHVTVVEGLNPDSGTFTGIGGNQGGPRSRFPMRGYEFFRDESDRQSERLTQAITKMNGGGPIGTLNAEVDFKNVPAGVRTSAEGSGFRMLKVNATKQAQRAGEGMLYPTDTAYTPWVP